ncbi:MAG: YdcF family protein [Anaerolineales bacterium]|nr:YdcF family protein [Anaerolineales bacterium]
MFVFLSKLLPLLIYPLGLACIFIFLALTLRRANRQRVALIAALLCLWLGGNRWVAMSLARSLEQRYLPPDSTPHAEAIVLLGGGTETWDVPRPMTEISSAGDRILYAASLYRQGAAPYILVSGGLLDWNRLPTTPAEDMTALLTFMGVPAEAIWQQNASRNTYEDAMYCARILREKGIQRILLVTSAAHMPRSVHLFEAQGLEVLPAPVDYTITDSEWRNEWRAGPRAWLIGLIPSADHLATTTRMLKEYLGMFIYDLRGWY